MIIQYDSHIAAYIEYVASLSPIWEDAIRHNMTYVMIDTWDDAFALHGEFANGICMCGCGGEE